MIKFRMGGAAPHRGLTSSKASTLVAHPSTAAQTVAACSNFLLAAPSARRPNAGCSASAAGSASSQNCNSAQQARPSMSQAPPLSGKHAAYGAALPHLVGDSSSADLPLSSSSYEYGGSDLGWRTAPLEQHYAKGKSLGQGSFGAVCAGVQLASGKDVAIKTMPKVRGKLTKAKTLEKLAREVDLLQRMQDCRSVVQIDDLFEDDDNVYIVTELLSGGDLQRFSDVYGPLNEKCLALIAFEVLLIIKSCHDFSVIHGDVKPANFCLREEHLNPLCSSESALRRTPWLKAIDFGCSQLHFGNPKLSKRSGTPVYMAPEIFSRSYSFEVDMWSMGVMLYQLFSRRFPFWDGESYSKALSLEEVAKAVTESPIRYDYGPWQQMSAEGLDFLQGCLTRDPQERLSVTAALQHPWLAKHRSCTSGGQGMQHDQPAVSNNIAPFTASQRRDAAVAA